MLEVGYWPRIPRAKIGGIGNLLVHAWNFYHEITYLKKLPLTVDAGRFEKSTVYGNKNVQ